MNSKSNSNINNNANSTSSTTVVETEEHRVFYTLRLRQAINTENIDVNNISNSDIQDSITLRNIEQSMAANRASLNRQRSILTQTGTNQTTESSVISNNSSAIREDSVTGGLYDSYGPGLFDDNNTILELPPHVIRTRAQALEFSQRIVDHHFNGSIRNYSSDEETFRENLGDVMRQPYWVNPHHFESYRTHVNNILGGDLSENLIRPFLLLSVTTLGYLYGVLTGVGIDIQQHIVALGLALSTLRGLFFTVANVSNLARHTTLAFRNIFINSLRQAQIILSGTTLAELNFNNIDMVDLNNRVTNALRQDADSVLAALRQDVNSAVAALNQQVETIRAFSNREARRNTRNNIIFYGVTGVLVVGVVVVYFRYPDFPSRARGFISNIFAFIRTLEGAFRAVRGAVDEAPRAAVQRYIANLDPALVDQRVIRVIENLMENFY
jgi:hypothetical protein